MNRFNINSHLALTLAAAIGLAGVTAVAHADAAADVPARTVRYSDLDLGTREGVTVLYRRIRGAADEVCGDRHSRDLAQAAAAKACIDRAIMASVRHVNNANLTRLYNDRVDSSDRRISLASAR